jgi:hypothetical protein
MIEGRGRLSLPFETRDKVWIGVNGEQYLCDIGSPCPLPDQRFDFVRTELGAGREGGYSGIAQQEIDRPVEEVRGQFQFPLHVSADFWSFDFPHSRVREIIEANRASTVANQRLAIS